MISKLKIIPLGGLGEIGKNITAIEFGSDIIVVDCGMGFPDETMYGVDIVLPDISYLKSNVEKIRGIILTHGHEDHIGAVPYVLKDLDVPIYTTPLTAALVELKLEEHDLLYNTQIFTKKVGSVFRLGCFTVEFINVNHSIPDSVALAITTPLGTIVHTGDFKFDVTPIAGSMIDLARFGQLGNEGVLALLSDSTNVEKAGHSDSERKVGEGFDKLFKGCDKRIIITTFASNVHRLQQIINVAHKYGRKVAITGRSMENVLRVASVLNYLNIPDDVMVDLEKVNKLPREKSVIISTGSQGEAMSALYRMAFSEHKQIKVDAGDRVIISASAIPGNETTISRVIDELFHKGAEVIYDRHTDLHVSGHASQEEQKMMLALIKPRFFIPVHGEYRHWKMHKQLAMALGMEERNIILPTLGAQIELSANSIKKCGFIPAGQRLIDGYGIGDMDSNVLRERKQLSEDGICVAVMTINNISGDVVGDPFIITRGVVYQDEAEAFVQDTKNMIVASLKEQDLRGCDPAVIKNTIRRILSNFILKRTKRRPMILTIVMLD